MDAQTAVGHMLDNIAAHGWNSATGQLFINWRIDSAGHVVGTDYQTSGLTDAQMKVSPPRSDGHTTMRYLEALYMWRMWQNDSTRDSEIAKAEAATKAFFGPSPSNPRGWIFFDLLDMAKYNTMWQQVANALLTGWKTAPMPIQSGIGATGDPDSRTDHQIEIGCAQVYSGDASGHARIDQAIALNRNPHGLAWDHGEIKSGETSQEAYCLAAINDPRGAAIVAAMDYLWDSQYGGYFAKDNMQTGIQNTKKEPGRSSDMLRAAWACGDTVRTQKILDVVLNKVYRDDIRGVVYESNPDFSLKTTQQNTPEDWVTTEAMGITMGALLRVAMSQQPQPTPTPVPPTPVPVPPIPTPQPPTPSPTPAPSSVVVGALQQLADDQITAWQKFIANLGN